MRPSVFLGEAMECINKQILEISAARNDGIGDYPYFRIPSIVCLDNGSMVMCCECRQDSDWSVIDLGMRISSDGGVSWSDRKTVVSGKGRNAVNNPTLLADGNDLILLYCENYKRMFCITSSDCGRTWSKATELTDLFDAYFWSCIAVGPGHGIVTKDGTYLATVWMAFNQKEMFSHHPSACCTIYSKDKGKTWHCGEVLQNLLADPSESALCECSDGMIYWNIRNENPEKCRAVCTSKNGYAQWSVPFLDQNLPDPTCFAGLCTHGGDLLFSNCRSKERRCNLTVSRSSDNGYSWEHLEIDESGGYSDICVNKNTGTSFVLYESMDNRYMMIAEILL